MDATRMTKVNFSLYPPEKQALADLVRDLKKAGMKVREGTVVRALLHEASAKEMVARSAALAADLAVNGGPAWGSGAGGVTPDILATDVKKMDAVIDQLARASITATRSFILRALLLSALPGKQLVPVLETFLQKFPYKPRGLSKLRLAAKDRRDD
jgi:hypothetical protein